MRFTYRRSVGVTQMLYSEKVRVFLTRHGMEPERIDFGETTAAFIGEMELGLRGRESSLRMIPTYLTADGSLPLGEPAVVIDAGGTNFRTALVSFTEAGPIIDSLNVCAMPGTDGAVAWEDFIAFAADHIAPLLDRASKVGFCFSYPTEETPERDGYVLSLTKQVQLTGFEGRLICADLAAELAKRGISGKSFVLLNDTPAVLLSGASYAAEQGCDGLMGLISGTGTNTCCVLPDESIKKPHGAFSGSMLVNLESGNFNVLPRGDYDVELDNATLDPGVYRHEKMTSGAYLGELCRLTLRGAAAEGLFSEEAAAKILSLEELNSAEADAMACGGGDMFTGEDAATASELCNAIFVRSARCVCANIASILVLTDRGSDPEHPACVCADGSVIRKSRAFREALDEFMQSFITDGLGRYAVIWSTENATMLGSAAAALLNG